MAPTDHIFDLERGLGRTRNDPNEFGPDIPVREYSFLSNARTPSAVTESVLTVELCSDDDSGESGCSDGGAPAAVRDGIARVRCQLNDEQLRTALGSAVRDYRVVRFTSVLGAFSRHAADADHERFVKRTRLFPSIWCCVSPPEGQPGHVWYDMWWDTVPHKDQHGRVWNSTWRIVTGP
jgi:arabinosyltransferase